MNTNETHEGSVFDSPYKYLWLEDDDYLNVEEYEDVIEGREGSRHVCAKIDQ